jgi:hypothetical protein
VRGEISLQIWLRRVTCQFLRYLDFFFEDLECAGEAHRGRDSAVRGRAAGDAAADDANRWSA